MIKLGSEHKVVITGAGGWLGTELLELLLAEFGPEVVQSSVVCLGSRERELILSDGTRIHINKLGTIPMGSGFAGIVHLAFQTRDKVEVLGIEKYCATNIEITSKAIELIEYLKPAWIATVSSGAIFSSPGGPLENNVLRNPYGFTKRIEETMLTRVAAEVGANIAIGRLWGAVGAYMPVNRAYAVSDFIVQAITTGKIYINSGNEVWRRYCNAADFMKVLVSSAGSTKYSVFDSGGELIELEELALELTKLIGSSIEIERNPNSNSAKSSYFPDPSAFDLISNKHGIKGHDFLHSLEVTLKNHQRNYKQH